MNDLRLHEHGLETTSDGDLLRRHRGGDARAFTELVRRHESCLLQHARALLGAGSTYEDAVQDTFLKLAQTPPSIPPEAEGDERVERAHLLSWLHKVTRNGCMDVMRSDTRRRRREHEAAIVEGTDGELSSVDERDTRAVVKREIEKLPPDQREVLVLRLIGDRSYKEIADITGRKIGTVGWLVSVGLKALGEKLEPLLAMSDAALSEDAMSKEESRSTRAATSSRMDTVQGEWS
jgi:RNA polymerase sigma-70 factor (ECF subfamily)